MSKNISGLFTRQKAAKPHLVRGTGGLAGEISDLRSDVVDELARVQAVAVESLSNIAAAAADSLLDALTTEPSAVSVFKAGGLESLEAIPRNVTFTAGGTASHIPPSVVVSGTDATGASLSETIDLSGNPGQGGAGLVSGTACFASITGLAFAAWAGASGTLTMGVGGRLGLSNKLRSRGGFWGLLQEVVHGALIPDVGIITDNFATPAAGDPDFFDTVVDAGPGVLVTGATLVVADFTNSEVPVPRNVTVTATDYVVTGSITFSGTDINGDAISEVVALTQNTITLGLKAFKTLTSIVIPAQTNGSGETLTFGFGDSIGLSQKALLVAAQTVPVPIQEVDNAAVVTNGVFTTSAVGAPNGTYTPNDVPDGVDSYAVTYRVEKGSVLTPTQAPPYGAYVPAGTPGGGMDVSFSYEYDATAP